MINYDEDDALGTPGDNAIKTIVDYATKQLDLEAEIEAAEKALSDLKNRHRELTEKTIPDFMREHHIGSFALDNGATIALKDDLRMSVPKDKKEFVARWLHEIGESGLVKHLASIDLGRGERAEKKAELLVEFIKTYIADSAFTIGEDVNTTSLKTVIAKRLAEGKPVPPLDQIGGYHAVKSTISFK
jgi:hypothetical protein